MRPGKISAIALLLLALTCSAYASLNRGVPSDFYTRFSLEDLVVKNGYVAASKQVYGIQSGVGGGGAGGRAEAKQTSFSKSETYSCQLKRADGGKFEEREFLSSFRRTVEAEIRDSGLSITKTELPKSSGFVFEYAGEGLKGRVKINGKRDGDFYLLKASLEESRTKSD